MGFKNSLGEVFYKSKDKIIVFYCSIKYHPFETVIEERSWEIHSNKNIIEEEAMRSLHLETSHSRAGAYLLLEKHFKLHE